MRLINPQWINSFHYFIDGTKQMRQMSDLLIDLGVFFAFPLVISADYMIFIARSVRLHIHKHTQTHNVSRKVLIAAKAMAINAFTVSSQHVHPLNNESFLAALRKEWAYLTSPRDCRLYGKCIKNKTYINVIRLFNGD